MYLKRIFINNYRTLVNTEAEFLDGLNILIGPNGSGKSNLLKFIENYISFFQITYIPKRITRDDVEYTVSLIDNNNKEIEFKIEVRYEKKPLKIGYPKIGESPIGISQKKIIDISKLKDDIYIYKNNIIEKWDTENHKNHIDDLNNIFKDSTIYIPYEIPIDIALLDYQYAYNIEYYIFESENIVRVIPDSSKEIILLEIISYFNDFFESKLLQATKLSPSNAKEFLLTCFEEFKNNYQISDILKRYTNIEDIHISNNINTYESNEKFSIENLLLNFKIQDKWLPWNHLSDGTKRLFCIISECIFTSNSLILIEEPELGIHPHQLYRLMDFIKEQSQSKQIIVSTHSPIVLDVLAPDELNRINIVKLENNETRLTKLTKEQIEKAQAYMKEVGDLSYYWLHSDLEND